MCSVCRCWRLLVCNQLCTRKFSWVFARKLNLLSIMETEAVWKESSTIIFVAPKDNNAISRQMDVISKESDFEILMLKRSERTAMSTNHAVFPGGLIESSADESVDWLQYFEEFGIEHRALKQLVIIDEQRPRILTPRGNGCYDRFFKRSSVWAREISLRINAIREAFEEVGILLCCSRDQIGYPMQMGSGHFRNDFDVADWQKRVHNDAREFIQLCRELKVIPDLWSLVEWGTVWATPAIVKKRYEAAFFITFLSDKPETVIEETEVQKCLWGTPSAFLEMFQTGELWLMPPQYYEISRLMNAGNYTELLAFMIQRHLDGKGCRLYLPVFYMCTDGMVGVLPGDDFYVPDPYQTTQIISMNSTITQFRSDSKRLHRIENSGLPSMKIQLNFDYPDKHLWPISMAQKNKL